MKKSERVMQLFSVMYSCISLIRIKGRAGNDISIQRSFLWETKINISGKRNLVRIHPENRLTGCTIHVIGNDCEVEIAEHCILSHLEIWIEDDGGKVIIGRKTTVESGHFAATEGKSITIGEDCMFSHRIQIRNGDSHSIICSDSNSRLNFAKDVIIDNHVWLGSDVCVLKGSTIGQGSVVASGAIVTGVIDSNSIYAGVPAKKIRDGIKWERER